MCSFWLCESIVANPIIYRLVPRPSRFETRQYLGHGRRHGLGQRCGICEHLSPTHNLSQELTAGLPAKSSCVQLRRPAGGCRRWKYSMWTSSAEICGRKVWRNNIFPIAQYLTTSLTKLFNFILNKGSYPDSRSTGLISPIFKSGNKSDPSNYRGICVTSCLGKLFSAVLNNRLLNYLQDHSSIHPSQIGFLKGFQTSDHIFSLRTLIDKYVTNANKGKLFCCFVDFQKAFDSIWHDGLLHKLLHKNIGGQFYHLISDMYSKTKCAVKNGNKRSSVLLWLWQRSATRVYPFSFIVQFISRWISPLTRIFTWHRLNYFTKWAPCQLFILCRWSNLNIKKCRWSSETNKYPPQL